MQITSSLLALAMAATSMAAVSTPLEVRAATSCSTPDGKGLCGTASACSKGFIAEGFCKGSSQCCVPSSVDKSFKEGDAGAPGADAGVLTLAQALAARDAYAEAEPLAEADAEADAEAEEEIELDEREAEAEAEELELEERDLEARANKGNTVYNWAKKQLGVKYVFGGGNCKGKTKGGFDCSGLTLYALCKTTGGKLKLPHSAQQQYKHKKGKHIKRSAAKQGDLLFWATNGNCKSGIKHVGIFQKKGYFINAPHTGAKVRVQKIWTKSGSLKICPSAVRFW